MTIREIAYRINEFSKDSEYKFGRIQYLRQRIKNKRPVTYLPFADFGIKDKGGNNYAFHTGGRQEIQFNIGDDYINGKEIFRYGLAFSLERGINLKDPIKTFENKFIRFNDYIIRNIDKYADYKMWYDDDQNIKHSFPKVQVIDKEIQKENYFIFIGKYLDKKFTQITSIDIHKILIAFDELLPLYEYVENENNKNERGTRIARMCWNNLGWIKPSGRKGKSKNKSHEKIYGFGHEEWNFDTEKLIDEYKFGFLEPIQRNRDLYIDMDIDILLYTVNSETKLKYWVGKLENVKVISRKESSSAYKLYRQKGWLDEMKQDLGSINLESNLLNEFITESEIFNIKFKVDDLQNSIFEKPIPAKTSDPRLKGDWYVLYHLPDKESGDLNSEIKSGFDFNTGSLASNDEEETKIKKTFESKEVEYQNKHKKIQNRFLKYLQTQYGQSNVRKECKAYGQNKIDIVRQSTEGPIFYEVKSYNHLSTSLRVALGQLFEYSFYPDVRNAIKLYLVSDLPPSEDFEKYIYHLNGLMNIPIGYIQFDVNKKEIIKEL